MKISAYNTPYADYLLDLMKEGEDCKDGFKKCGYLDSFQKIMCIKSGINCPINDIIINTKDNHSEDNITYTTIYFSEFKLMKYYLHYINERTNEHTITRLTLSEGEICLNAEEITLNMTNTFLIQIMENIPRIA